MRDRKELKWSSVVAEETKDWRCQRRHCLSLNTGAQHLRRAKAPYQFSKNKKINGMYHIEETLNKLPSPTDVNDGKTPRPQVYAS